MTHTTTSTAVLLDCGHAGGGMTTTKHAQAETYEKCAECHLFIESNFDVEVGCAEYVHLHTGSGADEALDGTHEARPSGEAHSLAHWKINGPVAMQARFVR